jgi:hypothetical protein
LCSFYFSGEIVQVTTAESLEPLPGTSSKTLKKGAESQSLQDGNPRKKAKFMHENLLVQLSSDDTDNSLDSVPLQHQPLPKVLTQDASASAINKPSLYSPTLSNQHTQTFQKYDDSDQIVQRVLASQLEKSSAKVVQQGAKLQIQAAQLQAQKVQIEQLLHQVEGLKLQLSKACSTLAHKT